MAQIDPTWGWVNKQQADSLRISLLFEKNDTLKMAAYRSLGFYYQEFIADSGLYFHEQQLALSKKLSMNLWQADAYSQAGQVLKDLGNIMKAYEYHSEAMKLAADEKNESDNWRPWSFSNAKNGHEARIAILGMNYHMMGSLWVSLREFEKAKSSYQQALKHGESVNNGKIIFNAMANLSEDLTRDSALMWQIKRLDIAAKAGFKRVGGAYLRIANIYREKGEMDSAKIYLQMSIASNIAENQIKQLAYSYLTFSRFFLVQKNKDSSLYYANKALETARLFGLAGWIQDGYQILADAYDLNNNKDSAFKYEKLSNKLNDSLKNARIASLTEYQKFAFNEQQRLKKMDEEKTAYANKLKMIGLITVLSAILLVAIILYRNNRQKHKANKVLESTLSNLKSTQTQLIQSEKMASLGELTAGIAHEIQNPLNFVNNFSELNTEMLAEMKGEIDKGNLEEVRIIANEIINNETKINHHGKRAERIVKGMLEHSRKSTGIMESTDLNKLCAEFVRLSYHGMKAKDKGFNGEYTLNLDPALPLVKVVSQDIGRVLLNIINNAFQATQEKAQKDKDYKPNVTVTTKILSKSDFASLRLCEIKITDNGPGIPENIKDKIFQPFFTTKPTGLGTGLGLSLAYDIVKAHRGELKVETPPGGQTGKDGVGSTFIISLLIDDSI